MDDLSARAHRVRASAIGTHAICQRRYWATTLPELAERAHKLDLPPNENVKAFVGTLVHWLAEFSVSDFQELSVKAGKFLDDIEHKNFYAKGWESRPEVIRGAWNMYQTFREHPAFAPWEDEASLRESGGEVELMRGMTLTGTIDLVSAEGVIHDIKTSSMMSGIDYSHQMAAYHVIAEKRGLNPKPEVKVVKIKRPANSLTERVIPIKTEIVPALALRRKLGLEIVNIANRADDLDEWKDDLTKIPANPGCGHCNFCSLRATAACPETSW